MSITAFSDPLGPRGRRKVALGSVVGVVVLGVLVALTVNRLGDKGQLRADRWTDLLSSDARRLFFDGWVATLKAAAISGLLSVSVGAIAALGRLSRLRAIRWVAGTYIELFRALPSLLLILFAFFGLPQLGIPTGQLSALVIGLTLYNSAVFAEIIRAGVLALPRGQTEAALAVGLTTWQTQRLVILPQAVSRMLPALVSQLVVVVKDTAYGFVIGYEELLRTGQIAGEFTGDLLQAYVLVAVYYILTAFALSRFARWLEGRQRHRYGRAAVVGTADLDLVGTPATRR